MGVVGSTGAACTCLVEGAWGLREGKTLVLGAGGEGGACTERACRKKSVTMMMVMTMAMMTMAMVMVRHMLVYHDQAHARYCNAP